LSKVASTGSPIATKYTVDSLTSNNWNSATIGVIIYGSLRFFSNLASEVRDNLFQPLSAYTSKASPSDFTSTAAPALFSTPSTAAPPHTPSFSSA
jgi:hypothetical protein